MLVRRSVPPEVEGWLTDRKKPVIAFQDGCYSCMTEVDPALKLPVAFPREEVRGSFGEAISRAGMKQLRCAEPERSAPEVAAEVVSAIRAGQQDFILVSFANPDRAGHTGALDAAMQAVEAVDAAIGAIAAAVREAGGALIVTADHGSSEQRKDDQGDPRAAHATNPAPLYDLLYYLNESDPVALRSGGRISDVAPTMLEILGLPQPEAMTGRSLRVPR
jgi:2,3-bisphosphoglycerate-independent phosphoglycerate mutase